LVSVVLSEHAQRINAATTGKQNLICIQFPCFGVMLSIRAARSGYNLGR